MKNILITGANGMIGGLILRNCLEREDVDTVTSIARKKTGIKHPKLTEVIHQDFMDYSSIADVFSNKDVCFYCIGVYTGQVPPEEFRKITVDYTQAFAKMLKQQSPHIAFCFLSGDGADRSEKSKLMFARDKGAAENILIKMKFPQFHSFRPGYIYPITPRKEPNMMYRIMRILYKPVLSWLTPDMAVTSEHLAGVMTRIGVTGGTKTVYENTDIRNYILSW